MQIEVVPIDQLHFDPVNARKHSEKNLKAIKGSLAKFGQQKPIVVDANNVVLAGNGTLAAAKSLGWSEIQVVRTKLVGSEAIAYALADNRSSELAEWEDSVLSKTLDALKKENWDLASIGFEDEDLTQWLTDTTVHPPGADEDEVPEHVDPVTKLGDLYQLGNHRLLCGDSTDVLQVERLMAAEKADMVFTDPPYGMDLNTDFSVMPKGETNQKFEWRNGSRNPLNQVKINSKKYKKIEGDNEEYDPRFLLEIFSYCKEIFLFGADYYIKNLPKTYQLIIWDKTTNESADRSFGSNFEIVWSKTKHKKDFCRIRSGVFGVKDDSKIRIHPTQKPVQVAEWFFDRFGNLNDIVVDLYLGSGSTLIACEKTNRRCYGMEIDPHYCDVIVARWEKYTGKKAILVPRES